MNFRSRQFRQKRKRAMFFSHILYKTLEHLLKFMKVRARL